MNGNWRNILIAIGIAVVGVIIGVKLAGGSGGGAQPVDPPAEEQCATNGQTCACWDMPPGSPWQYVCCDPYKHVSDASQCGSCPAPTPGPTTPPPSPVPSPAVCRTTRVDYFENNLKPHGGQQVDFTVKACGGDVVRTNNNCGANCCELSAEKGNGACADKLFGMPQWYPTGVKLYPVHEDNTYTQKVVASDWGSTSGKVRVCGHATGNRVQPETPGNCVIADVIVADPPCTVTSTQGCASNWPPTRNSGRKE